MGNSQNSVDFFENLLDENILSKTAIDDQEWLSIREEDLMEESFVNVQDMALASSTLEWWEQRSMLSIMGLKKIVERLHREKRSVDLMVGLVEMLSSSSSDKSSRPLATYLSNLRMEFLGTAKNCFFTNQITKRLNIITRVHHAILRQNARDSMVCLKKILKNNFCFSLVLTPSLFVCTQDLREQPT